MLILLEHGAWAMAGARHGTYMAMLTEWDYREVQWFDTLEELWQSVRDLDPESMICEYQDALKTQLYLPMVREIDPIRRQERW